MAQSPRAYDKGTRFTNYSSIHSADAFVGDYQVMYTPGSTSPQFDRVARKPSRFSRAVSSAKPVNMNQSFLLPSNMPNTSQIMPDHGALPNIQVHYNIPADEKQIVASLRSLQRDLADAMQTINDITRERDEALQELRLLRTYATKPVAVSRRQNMAAQVEEELFDLSRSEASPQPAPKSKKVAIEKQTASSDDARVLSPLPINTVPTKRADQRVSSKTVGEDRHNKKPMIEDTEQSVVAEDPTAVSNTSRRRRRTSLDENMTSAYILPDITEQQELGDRRVSKEAQQIIHSHDPEHIAHCDVCRRLTANTKAKSRSKPSLQQSKPTLVSMPHQPSASALRQQSTAKIDYTAQVAGFHPDESFYQHQDATMRPKISPNQALSRVRALMGQQFARAKERHHEAWLKYDSIEAPVSSRKHAAVSKEMRHWAEKMEECRVHLDYLRDVEEGMEESV